MGSENRSIARYEITAVYSHPDAKVDIVLVHGLNGSPDKTWTAKNGVFWPLDLLPASLKGAHANVLVYGYNADVYSKRNDQSASDNFIHQHAQTLITTLTLYRRSVGTLKNPIIWVCHSLGGILVKRSLLYSNDVRAAHHDDYRSIYVSTYGLIFLGTPHSGSDAATWAIMLQAMSDAVVLRKFFETESVLLKTLKKDNESLANINNHFLDIYQRFRIHMAHENHKTDVKGTKVIIVDANSASPALPGVTYYGIEAAHAGMCKFSEPSAPGYRNISTDIRQWVLDAPAMIQVRWEVEEEERRSRARMEATERLTVCNPGPTVSRVYGLPEQLPTTPTQEPTASKPLSITAPKPVSNKSDEPLFIHPERFRPNAYFKGRQQELGDLHLMLMDKDRRNQGTSAVLIWSVPGGGKSCLAREYAFKHRHEYSGGVFWIRGKAQEDLEDGFLKIAKNLVIRGNMTIKDESDLQDPSKAIRLVRKWLNRSENWLLILDGVLRDTPGLTDYIPYARNTSLILTSTDSSIAGNHKFDAPQKIELSSLSEQDAQIMLLEEMDKKKPWTQDDLSRALEAVNLMDCLPLAVHAAAKQMRATREPLSKYIRAYKNRPRAGGLGAYKGVREKLLERGDTEALNLMYLLSVFTARIPVELLALGLKALDKRTPVRTKDSSGNASLNKTFKVLITFALIERDEIEDVPSTSATSPDSSHQSARAIELLDVLKIHSVVQTFFRENLRKEKQFEFWLERAAAVLCRSFDEGNTRANINPDIGLPDDYRRYAAQIRRILEHISRVNTPTPELKEAKTALQGRLTEIQGRVSTKPSIMTTHVLGEGANAPHVSIFERTNSLSIPSSVTTADSRNGENLDLCNLGPPVASDQQANLPTLETNPHHYHVPYPRQSTIPMPREGFDYEDLGDRDTSVIHHKIHDSLPTHRTVRERALRRYLDRAGAWREVRQKVNEPRASKAPVSISREIALGQFSPVVSTLSRPASSGGGTLPPTFTEAKQHLAHLRNTSQGDSNFDIDEAETVNEAHEGSLQYEITSGRKKIDLGRSRVKSSPATAMASRTSLRMQIRPRSRDTMDENPFWEQSSFGAASLPSARHDEGWRPPSRDDHLAPSQLDLPLEIDVGHWMPVDLPIVVNSSSSLSPAVYPYQPLGSQRKATDSGYSGDCFSNSLPSSNESTLHPAWRVSSLKPDGYSSQPLSRNPSSNSELPTLEDHEGSTSGNATSQNVPIQTRRAPSLARTEPSPRIGVLDGTPTSYQVWQQRNHTGPWSSERLTRRDLHLSSSASDGVEMVRSGSGGIYFKGRIVEFGQSPLGESVYPPEIAETELFWGLEESTAATVAAATTSTATKLPGLGIVEEH